ncbi:MAG: aminoacyl-tRNA hydrolase [Bacteroidia bacterium]|nr:aminoacyl-tRNA hydrolase [Bacteroidia bacterium]NND25256.1 aminoacyl-tRNA hydrolase [Flavobacteriaceae bacterium]NNK61099.1 aminoacyl-tRNA hydrolase [Flavobacteriaceae bacterium]RZW57322.1 MAG: aminoacyl-tRNA hydrolase [Flavobacteriaceae bacterium]
MNKDLIITEIKLKGIRSSGSGGQHVNKVSSKVELSFDLDASNGLSDNEKDRLKQSIGNRLTASNILLLQCDEARSQLKNKDIITKRFFSLLKDGLKKKKKRIPTKTPKSVLKNRQEAKQRQSQKKKSRKKPDV